MAGLNKLIGMSRLKELARIDIDFCRVTGEPFGHTLINGVGGLGKTALAEAIAEELLYHFVAVEAAALKNRDKIIDRLCSAHEEARRMNKRLLLFVDEAHRLSLPNQEVFYFPLDKNRPRVTTAQGEIEFPKFTMIAATTRRDALDEASFVGRFDNIWHLERYDSIEICQILSAWFSTQYGVRCLPNELNAIAGRSIGVPRQAIRLASKIRNYVIANHRLQVSKADCDYIFGLEKIDGIGLGELHRRYLKELYESGVPRGLDAIAGKLGQNKDVVDGTIEPILLCLGLVDMTARGRVLTAAGREHVQNVK